MNARWCSARLPHCVQSGTPAHEVLSPIQGDSSHLKYPNLETLPSTELLSPR